MQRPFRKVRAQVALARDAHDGVSRATSKETPSHLNHKPSAGAVVVPVTAITLISPSPP